MDEHNYADLLILQSVELTGSTRFCPEDQEIAEYFDGVLPQDEQGRLERHLTDCRYCLARVGVLSRLEGLPFGRRIPGDVLATAKAMTPTARGHRQKAASAWAVAALVVLAFGVVSQLHNTWQIGRDSYISAHAVERSGQLRETRNISLAPKGPIFLDPAEGFAVIPEGYLFRWTPVPNSHFYQVRIISDSGDLLWQERIAGTEWKIPAGTRLTPGAEYFVRVEAFLSDTRTLKSDYLLFRVEEHR